MYPESLQTILKKNFERFDENIDDNGVRDVVKNEIIMFLYNKRNMVVKHQEETELLAPALDI